jgi:hypothetical protein
MDTVPPDPNGQQDSSHHSADHTAAFKFLDFIFDGVEHGFVEFQYFSPGRRPKKSDQPTYLNLPLQHEQVVNEVLNRNGQRMITVGLAPRCRIPGKGRTGHNQDILQVGCIWAGLDNAKAPGGPIDIIGRIKSFPLRPSVVVNSGYGYHVYFAFHSPLSTGELLTWSELIRGLRTALHIDTRTDLCEVMRLPGTLNIKEPHLLPCEILEEYSSWTRYSIEEVHRAIDESVNRPLVVPSPLSLETLKQRGLTAEVLDAIVTGQGGANTESGYDGESGRDFWISSVLFEKNFSEDEIITIFKTHPDGCGSNWARKRDGEKYLKLTLRKASARLAQLKDSSFVGGEWEEDEENMLENALPHGYVLNDGSIWYNPPVLDTDKKLPKAVKVSNSLIRIAEIHENIDTGEISLAIAFDYLGRTRLIPISRSEMADSRRLVSALACAGAPVTSNNARLVTAYLAAYEHAFASTIPHKKVTSHFGRGRTSNRFFFPGLNETVEFAPSGPGDAALYKAYSSRRGTLGGWLEVMRTLSNDGLMIPQVAVLASFVPPIQSRLQIPNFVLDIYGNSSTGKSTSLKLAASVYGRPYDPDSLVLQWMNTQVAVEQVASLCSELPIFLDDAQHCPAELKRAIIYMVANGRGKGRSARGLGIQEVRTWHTVALSTSEEPLHESSPHEGARGRILPIGGATPPFNARCGDLVQSLERAVIQNHGYAGETYLRHLNGWTESDWLGWHRRYTEVRSSLLRSSSSNLIGRVSGYISAIQIAAEIAGPLIGLRFKPDVVSAWLMLNLIEQQSNQNIVLLALRALADYYVSNIKHFASDGLYNHEKQVALYGASKKQKYVGYLRSTVDTVFKSHKWNSTSMLNKMAEAKVIFMTEDDRHTKKISVGGVKHRMVCIKWSAVFPEDIDG